MSAVNSANRAGDGSKCAISVVIPLYNKGVEIERTLQSVLNQTFQDFEIIVIDDGSTDNGAEVVARVDDTRISLVRQSNSGVSVARNRGIAESNSSLIAFLDADDQWKPTFLSAIWKLRTEYPQAGLYGTAYVRHLPNHTTDPLNLPTLPDSGWHGILENYWRTALDDNPICSSAVAIPRSVFATVGCFPPGIRMGEDLDMWLRVALCYPVAYSNSVEAIYHQTASNRATQQRQCNERLVLADSAYSALNQGIVPAHHAADLREYVYKFQLLTAFECAKAGNLPKAREMLAMCRHTHRFRKQWLWWRAWLSLPLPLFNLAWYAKRALGG